MLPTSVGGNLWLLWNRMRTDRPSTQRPSNTATTPTSFSVITISYTSTGIYA